MEGVEMEEAFGDTGGQEETVPRMEEDDSLGISEGEEDNLGSVGQKKLDIRKQEIYNKYRIKIEKERPGKPMQSHPKFGKPSPLNSDRIPTYRNVICAILHNQSVIRMKENLKQNPSTYQVVDLISEQLEEIGKNLAITNNTCKDIKRKKDIKTEVNKSLMVISHWNKKKMLTEKFEMLLLQTVKIYMKDTADIRTKQQIEKKERIDLRLGQEYLQEKIHELEKQADILATEKTGRSLRPKSTFQPNYRDEVYSSSQELEPSSPELMPSSHGLTPSSESQDQIQSSQGRMPSSQDLVQSSQDLVQSSQGLVASSHGREPSSPGRVPSSQGLVLSSQELVQSSQEMLPTSQTSSSAQEWETPPPTITPFRVFGTKTFFNTSEAIDRFQIPPNQAAHLINAFQVDTGCGVEKLLDPHKLKRDREIVRSDKLESQRGKVVTGLGIDGRKDQTLLREIVTDEDGIKVFGRNVKKKIDNVSVISTPDGIFIGHFVPESGSGCHNREALCDLLDRRGIDFRLSLVLLNLDGTSTNTGGDLGLAAQLEEEFERALQWAICFLHHLDRPWLHLLLALDGRSLGPESFSGPIGQIITSAVHLLPVVKFQPIPVDEVFNFCPISHINDCKYLYI